MPNTLRGLWGCINDGDISRIREANNQRAVPLDMENVSWSGDFGVWDDEEAAQSLLIGWQEWAVRPFIGGQAGGDDEYPQYFIVYQIGEELRIDVPVNGNVFDAEDTPCYQVEELKLEVAHILSDVNICLSALTSAPPEYTKLEQPAQFCRDLTRLFINSHDPHKVTLALRYAQPWVSNEQVRKLAATPSLNASVAIALLLQYKHLLAPSVLQRLSQHPESKVRRATLRATNPQPDEIIRRLNNKDVLAEDMDAWLIELGIENHVFDAEQFKGLFRKAFSELVYNVLIAALADINLPPNDILEILAGLPNEARQTHAWYFIVENPAVPVHEEAFIIQALKVAKTSFVKGHILQTSNLPPTRKLELLQS